MCPDQGKAELPVTHGECVAALLTNPVELIFGAIAELIDVDELQATQLSVQLTRRPRRLPGALGRVVLGPKGTEFVLTSQTWSTSGLTELKIVDLDEVTALQVIAAATPVGEDRTQLRWRARCRGDMFVRGRNRALRALTVEVASGAHDRARALTREATTTAAFATWRALEPGHAQHARTPELAVAGEGDSGGFSQ
ncbi:hypothetical protein JMUB5695_00802 [Mycobacterium heckeshornense]|uniref:hypothetical protein n=1 Tax=Mycobacterium heckeshornense TaxID=110505 RepID=UPI0019427E80|nr:hypothetical protein [Mycobacterium heckeshornense]BCQ07381.1 hypothetical protein JMUB5695_00802 [Mycobacterium heckeshornense]